MFFQCPFKMCFPIQSNFKLIIFIRKQESFIKFSIHIANHCPGLWFSSMRNNPLKTFTHFITHRNLSNATLGFGILNLNAAKPDYRLFYETMMETHQKLNFFISQYFYPITFLFACSLYTLIFIHIQ